MKFLRYSISLTSCLHQITLITILLFQKKITLSTFTSSLQKQIHTKNQEHFFILCFVKNSKILIGVILKT